MIRPNFPGKKFAQICGREKATEKMGIYRMCLCFTREFMDFEPKAPDDLREVFEKYTGGESHMTPEQLRRFIIDEGGVSEEKAVEEVMRRRKRHHHHNHHHRHHHISLLTSILNRDLLTLEDFLSCFLFSVDLNPPIISQVRQDKMTAPLSHYFIYTGHNSYLTGNQLSSNSSDVPIIKALKRGVRAIELDLWPNSSKDDVHVLHGRTLTPPVDLPKCLKSIKEHAFSASPYPLILTLEDHLTPDLQARVAQMITEIFGEMLFFPESECFKELPSPEQLKYRIIISTKLPKNNAVSYSSSSGGSQGKGGSSVNLAAPFIQVQSSKEDEVGSTEGSDLSNPIEGDDSDKDSVTSSPSRPPVYKRLISIPTIPRHNVKKALKLDLGKVARLSLSEESFEKAATTYGEDLVRFTQKNILRIFPKLTRINSSNYKPFHGWTHGAQMVAFNMQGHGKFLWWMQGMFRANGGCGYVKKPDFLLNLGPDDKILFDPKANLPVKTSLKVKVYMGYGWNLDFKQTHFDAYSPPDFYTKVGIAGVPADEAMKKTKIKGDQCWDEEFEFPLRVPELALLRIEVRKYNISKKDDIAGQTCLPIWELRPGTRAVPLYSHKGVRYESVKLLVRFQLT